MPAYVVLRRSPDCAPKMMEVLTCSDNRADAERAAQHIFDVHQVACDVERWFIEEPIECEFCKDAHEADLAEQSRH